MNNGRFEEGQHSSPQTEFKKRHIPWNKGKKGVMPKPWNKGKPFPVPSEKTKRKISEAITGEKHWYWKGGRRKGKNGYIHIYSPNHPFCGIHKIVFEHRLIIEKQIGRYLQPNEMSHHINKIKDDNRPENLMAFKSRASHVNFEEGRQINPSDIIFDGRKL